MSLPQLFVGTVAPASSVGPQLTLGPAPSKHALRPHCRRRCIRTFPSAIETLRRVDTSNTPLHSPLPTMASFRSALRLAPRAQFVRPSAVSRIAPLAYRSYASAQPNPATDLKPVSEAEQGSEDLGLGDDPNMVCHHSSEDECCIGRHGFGLYPPDFVSNSGLGHLANCNIAY